MFKPFEEIQKLNTKNLLRYYKAERKRFYASGYLCNCGCNEFTWIARSSEIDMEQKYNDHKKYLESIKKELNTREHID